MSQTAAVVTQEAPRRRARGTFAFLRNRKAATGAGILGFFILIGIIGPWIAPFDPNASSPDLMAPPSWQHWLGTTNLGQDILSQLIVGTQGVLIVGLVSGVAATILAVIVGVTAGFIGGVGDEALSMITNIFLVIPGLPLIIIVASQFREGGMITIALVIAITGWAWGARVLRAQTLSLRRRDFVQAARAGGEPVWRIITVEMLPNLSAIIASSFVGTVTAAILAQITLAFIGVTSVSQWNWGTILFWAQSNQALARGAWWWFVPAGLCIALLGMSLALMNFGIDEIVNPRLRSDGITARALKKRGISSPMASTPVTTGTATIDAALTKARDRPGRRGDRSGGR